MTCWAGKAAFEQGRLSASRQNHHGDPCPPWCTADHSKPGPCVGGGSAGMDRDSLPDSIWTRAIRNRDGFRVSVSAALPDVDAAWPHLSLDLRDAESLAVMVELLADATPEQHRGLAAAIRKAAAEIAEASGA